MFRKNEVWHDLKYGFSYIFQTIIQVELSGLASNESYVLLLIEFMLHRNEEGVGDHRGMDNKL